MLNPDNASDCPRHVLMTVDTVGGVWTYALQLCSALARFKINVSVATMGPAPTPRHRAELRQIRNAELYESTFQLEWTENAEQDLQKAGDWLLSLAARVRPDLVHLNGYTHAALPWGLPIVVTGHSCLLSWWEAVKKDPMPQWFAGYRARVAAGLRAAHVVVSPTRAMLGTIDRLYGPLACTAVIPNGRSGRLFPPGRKEDLILSTGRLWDQGKNIAALDQIARKLPWPVYVAGDSLHPNGSRVEFRNAIGLGSLAPPELAPWFSRAGIYAAPAHYEPFGLSILEAALAGCALVLGDIPSLRENWEGVALFAPPNDPVALEAEILRLIRDPHMCRKLAAVSASRAKKLSPGAMANAYVHIYGKAMQQRSPARVPPPAEERIAECA